MKRIMSNLISKNSSLIKQFSSLNAIRNDPYLSKYEQKLLQKQRELGFETVEEMVKAKRVKPVENLSELKTANSSEKKASSSNNLPPHIKPLSEILNVSL